jgi:hypothetical protein
MMESILQEALMNPSLLRKMAALTLAVLISVPAVAADVKFGGLVFGGYEQNLSKKDSTGGAAKSRGEFKINRIYMNADAKFSPKLKGKLVLEGNTTAATDTGHGSNPVFVKYAFGEYALHDLASVHFGLLANPWNGNEEKVWGRRFVEKVQADLEGKHSSADKGVGLFLKDPKGYAEFFATYVNGEGTSTVELSTGTGKFKDWHARLSVAPLKDIAGFSGLKLHAYTQQGQIRDGGARRRDRYIGGVSYEHDKFHVMASYIRGDDGNGIRNLRFDGYSLHGSAKVSKKSALFARMDRFSKAGTGATAATMTDTARRFWFGADYKVAEGARIALTDTVYHPSRPIPYSKNNQHLLRADFELKF